MADVMDVDSEEIGEIEAVEQEIQQEPAKEAKEQEPDIPEKYRGKSVKELVEMHQNTEKALSRQAQEVGEVRKLADELLRSQIQTKAEPEKQEVDFFENPQEAIRQAVENNPKLKAAEAMVAQMAMAQAKQAFEAKHPDAREIIKDTEFQNWVKASKIRIGLFQAADAYNVDVADELISTYKQLKATRQAQEITEDKKVRDTALKAASVDSGGSGESGRKVYRRADLIRLKLTNPSKYAAMEDEINAAYQEGRIK